MSSDRASYRKREFSNWGMHFKGQHNYFAELAGKGSPQTALVKVCRIHWGKAGMANKNCVEHLQYVNVLGPLKCIVQKVIPWSICMTQVIWCGGQRAEVVSPARLNYTICHLHYCSQKYYCFASRWNRSDKKLASLWTQPKRNDKPNGGYYQHMVIESINLYVCANDFGGQPKTPLCSF